ncbi:hypothetical protein AHAS_Ahas08G0028500 [Arachis hypogaea]
MCPDMTGHDRLECPKRCKHHRKRLGISGKVFQKRRTPRRHENTPENAMKPKIAEQPTQSVIWAVTFLPFIHASVKITRHMGFPLQAAQMITYIFNDCMNPDEKLFCRDDQQLDLEAFSSLLHGNERSSYILELLALRTSCTQSQLQRCSVWSLPLIFLVTFPYYVI